jgi:coatomer subunit beta'
VQTLEGHSHNVSVICFHPELPIIVSGSEDGSVRIWHANTYRLEKTLNYGMERVWAMSYLKGSNFLALGYDEGTVLLKVIFIYSIRAWFYCNNIFSLAAKSQLSVWSKVAR